MQPYSKYLLYFFSILFKDFNQVSKPLLKSLATTLTKVATTTLQYLVKYLTFVAIYKCYPIRHMTSSDRTQ